MQEKSLKQFFWFNPNVIDLSQEKSTLIYEVERKKHILHQPKEDQPKAGATFLPMYEIQ